MSGYGADDVAGIETALDGRAHDAEGLSRERLRTRAPLQIGKQGLLGSMGGEHVRRDRNEFGRAGGAARLRVEQRSFHRERLHAGTALFVHVGAQHLVVLHGHPLAKLRGRSNVGKSMVDAEPGALIRGEQPAQHIELRDIGLVRHPFDRAPVPVLVPAHRRAQQEPAHLCVPTG